MENPIFANEQNGRIVGSLSAPFKHVLLQGINLNRN